MSAEDRPRSIEELRAGLEEVCYFADADLGTAIHLALQLQQPLLLEGEAGVGKTAVACALSSLLRRELIRLQCYEGLDTSTAVYEWDYARQMLQIRLIEAAGHSATRQNEAEARAQVFSEDFLLRRPLLRALQCDARGRSPVLLIDELDRADEEFEAYLLELLSDYQITIPEIGTVVAAEPPIVIVTSNRTRDIHDALRRRCLYHWIDYPSFEKEHAILVAKVAGASERLSREVVTFVQQLRTHDLYKRPGVAETLDWATALVHLDRETLTADAVEPTLGVLLKYQDDIESIRGPVLSRTLDHVAQTL